MTDNEHIVAQTCECPFVKDCIVAVVQSGLMCVSLGPRYGRVSLFEKGGTEIYLSTCQWERIVFSGKDKSKRGFDTCNSSGCFVFMGSEISSVSLFLFFWTLRSGDRTSSPDKVHSSNTVPSQL